MVFLDLCVQEISLLAFFCSCFNSTAACLSILTEEYLHLFFWYGQYGMMVDIACIN